MSKTFKNVTEQIINYFNEVNIDEILQITKKAIQKNSKTLSKNGIQL